MTETFNAGGRSVEVTHADRILFPKDGITKADLVAYYRDVTEAMLPHIAERPLHMQRFPRGIGEPGFHQKEATDGAPDWIDRATVDKEGGQVTHLVAAHPADLVYLANVACITPHIWQSRRNHIDLPDRMVFDLDPATDDFAPARAAAVQLRAILERLKLPAFLMTTGSRGLHVVVPLMPELDFDSVRDFSQAIAEQLVDEQGGDSSPLTTAIRKNQRHGGLFIDTLRNSYGATAVAPYAVRAIPGAPVAMPLLWQDLDDPTLTAHTYNLRNVRQRLIEQGDAWRDLELSAVSLRGADIRFPSFRAAA